MGSVHAKVKFYVIINLLTIFFNCCAPRVGQYKVGIEIRAGTDAIASLLRDASGFSSRSEAIRYRRVVHVTRTKGSNSASTKGCVIVSSKGTTYLPTYLLTPWCRVLLENLTGLQLVKKFPTFHGTRRFITTLTSVRHLSVSWASPIQSIYPHPTSWRCILILSTHLCLGLPTALLPAGFPTKTLHTPSPHPFAPHAQAISFHREQHKCKGVCIVQAIKCIIVTEYMTINLLKQLSAFKFFCLIY